MGNELKCDFSCQISSKWWIFHGYVSLRECNDLHSTISLWMNDVMFNGLYNLFCLKDVCLSNQVYDDYPWISHTMSMFSVSLSKLLLVICWFLLVYWIPLSHTTVAYIMLQSQLFKTYATGNPSVQKHTGAIWILETSSSFCLKGVIQCVMVTNQCEDPYLVLTQSGDASSCWGSSRCWFQLVCKRSTLPEKRTCCTWKNTGSVTFFLSGRLSGRCHVSFRECKPSNT